MTYNLSKKILYKYLFFAGLH